VPDRLLVSAVRTFGPEKKWIVSSMVEIRNGFPYSVVDEDQQFVGLRNAGGRFPLFYTLDAQVQRTFAYRGRKFRWGVRANHVLNTFMPRDVQNNIDSVAFRTFYNSFPPAHRVHGPVDRVARRPGDDYGFRPNACWSLPNEVRTACQFVMGRAECAPTNPSSFARVLSLSRSLC
jgi:hypothetical protein